MRIVSFAECSTFEDVRKLFERAFGEIDEINLVIAPEKAKRLEQIVKDNALIEKEAQAKVQAEAKAEVKAKEIADAQLVIDNAESFEKKKAETEAKRNETLKNAKKVIADSKKKGGK